MPRRGRWQPGESGNPTGRRPGSPDRRSHLRSLIRAQAPELIQLAVAAAKAGEMTALGLLLARCVPPLRPASDLVTIDLPPGASLADQARAVLAAIAGGRLDPMTGRSLIDAIAGAARVIETDELLRRIEALEGGSDEP